jgi:uncharacterized protein (TIGR03083 family)
MTEKRSGRAALPNEARAVTAPESALGDAPGQALADAYEGTYKVIGGILGRLTDDQLVRVIPACPAWTVRELVAHMTGTAADAITARFPPVNPHGPWAARQLVIDGFTAGQVAARDDMTLAEVRGEWAGHVPVLVNMLRGMQPFPPGSIPIINWMVVCDITAHNQDLRGALELPGDRDSPGVALSLKRYVAGLSQRIAAAGLAALGLRTEQDEYVAGYGAPSVALTATGWELFRALCSRRSESQIRSYRWTGDADPYVPLLPAYGLPSRDLIE